MVDIFSEFLFCCLKWNKMTGEHIEYVFFDMETTGFQEPIRPVQIGAVGNGQLYVPTV